ncbi:MAG: hypothetical protein H6510_16470 [Acidobacteria bacterium]|nr:hypothetical protein [Acidobacteriota bacterium]MCB9399409.1 hypothetical protein [Acidobacteriota bacterium]
MTRREGPPLADLLNRMVATPADFLREIPLNPKLGDFNILALINDLFLHIDGTPLKAHETGIFIFKKQAVAAYRNHMRLAAFTAWLLFEPLGHQPGLFRQHLIEWLSKGLAELGHWVTPEQVRLESDRREEFVRLCLRALGLRPAGESIHQAEDRLSTLDSAERARTVEKARLAEQRAREIREAMARKRAQEAAATYGRE